MRFHNACPCRSSGRGGDPGLVSIKVNFDAIELVLLLCVTMLPMGDRWDAASVRNWCLSVRPHGALRCALRGLFMVGRNSHRHRSCGYHFADVPSGTRKLAPQCSSGFCLNEPALSAVSLSSMAGGRGSPPPRWPGKTSLTFEEVRPVPSPLPADPLPECRCQLGSR